MSIRLHTLGPSGTNCEAAAKHWIKEKGYSGEVVLYEQLESAVKEVKGPNDFLLACVVYPKLNNIYFENIQSIKLVDCFLFDTHEMVLASKHPMDTATTIIVHPAPAGLADPNLEITFANSNAHAAIEVANGNFDSCITTLACAKTSILNVLKSFGKWNMGFTIHGRS